MGLGLTLGTGSVVAEQTVIRGKVIFKGNADNFKRKKIDTSKDPNCKKAKKAIGTHNVILNKKTDPITIRDVMVSISEGLGDRVFPAPSKPVILTQVGCEYSPHVITMTEGQELKVLNGDDTNHNIHFLPKVNEEMNFSQPKKDLENGRSLKLQAEEPFHVKCDVHPWMGCNIGVFKHPFHDVSDKAGTFEIKGMSGGTYTLKAWHEEFGTREVEVTVATGATANVDIVFEVE
jgi:plastocyanin